MASPSSPRALFVVAHPDDSLIFQCPSLLRFIANDYSVVTVHLNAGDHGRRSAYWRSREAGIRAAYAEIAGVADDWDLGQMTLDGRRIALQTLKAKPGIQVLFLRLPDGGFPDGSGTLRYGFESLSQLWDGTLRQMTTVDGRSRFSRPGLVDALAKILFHYEPSVVATLDNRPLAAGDHADHVAAGAITVEAQRAMTQPHLLLAFEGYESSRRPANVSADDLRQKRRALLTYGAFDSEIPRDLAALEESPYATWLEREYFETVATQGVVADAGPPQCVAVGATVTLNGRCEPGDVGAVTYEWLQTSGVAVTLSDPRAASPSFIAPSAATEITFDLEVWTQSGASARSRVIVRVR